MPQWVLLSGFALHHLRLETDHLSPLFTQSDNPNALFILTSGRFSNSLLKWCDTVIRVILSKMRCDIGIKYSLYFLSKN